jgi:hypothetical protein
MIEDGRCNMDIYMPYILHHTTAWQGRNRDVRRGKSNKWCLAAGMYLAVCNSQLFALPIIYLVVVVIVVIVTMLMRERERERERILRILSFIPPQIMRLTKKISHLR